MPQAPTQPCARKPLPPSGAGPVLPGGTEGGAPTPGPVKLQLSLIAGDRVVPWGQFELPAAALAALREVLGATQAAASGPVQSGAAAGWPSAEPGSPATRRYSLSRDPGCWVLVFQGGCAHLKHEVGLAYAACLLSQPDERIPSAKLFSQFSGSRKGPSALELPNPETAEVEPVTDGLGVGQTGPDNDDVRARRRYEAQLREWEAQGRNRSLAASQRKEARRSARELRAFLKKHYPPAPNPGRDITKRVHKSIQRLCKHLEESANPVAAAFGAYIQQHILRPSRRYTRAKAGANVRIARGELAGRLVFECPPEDHWSVRL